MPGCVWHQIQVESVDSLYPVLEYRDDCLNIIYVKSCTHNDYNQLATSLQTF